MNGRQQWAETGVGAAVIAAAAAFLIYALSHAAPHAGTGAYELVARFGQIGSLATGSDVKVAGVKVGTVTGVDLDPKTFLARTRISVRSSVKLPVDSSIKITSDSLLGGQHVAIDPGGSMQDMKPGAEFQNVQGAVDLFGLIGQVIRPPAPAASAAAPAAATTPAPTANATGASADPYPEGN